MCIRDRYESVRQYADSKKGIVYAISISHARNIAGYYNQYGMNTIAIDSKTPANERKRLVENFRQGKIQVLVNVDVFSEGFDCPDVEFIQLARPTLSLPKYLQQVGRGLRKTEGKESCMIIDNVGLYRLFGLPTAHRDWQAMFEGRLAGKGYPEANTRAVSYMALSQGTDKDKTAETDGQLETIVSHGQLLDYLQSGKSLPENDSLQPEKLRPFKDRASGLYGLKRGNKITSTARYHNVLDTDEGLATVCFDNGQTGIVDESGNVRMRLGRCRSAKFMKGNILALTVITAGKHTWICSAAKYTINSRGYGSSDLYKYLKRTVCITAGQRNSIKSGKSPDVIFSMPQVPVFLSMIIMPLPYVVKSTKTMPVGDMTACACLQMTMTPITVIAACCLAEALSSWTMSASITLWRKAGARNTSLVKIPRRRTRILTW